MKQLSLSSLCAFACIIFCSLNLQAQYATPGTGIKWSFSDLATHSSGAVTQAGNVFTIHQNITVSAGDTLAVSSDITVKIVPNIQLIINGTGATFLIDAPNQAIFTVSENGAYYGVLEVAEASSVHWNNVLFEFGQGIRVIDSDFVIKNSTIQNMNYTNNTSGAISGIRGKIAIENCQFLNNQRAAVSSGATMGTTFVILNSYFYNNTLDNSNRPQINIGPCRENDTTKIIGNKIIGVDKTMVGGIGCASLLGDATVYIVDNNDVRNNRYGITFTGGNISGWIRGNQIIDNNLEVNPMNGGSGINITGSNINAVISNNLITGSLWGITLVRSGTGTLTCNMGNLTPGNDYNEGRNIFYNNGNGGVLYDLYNNSPSDVMAQNNFWGVAQQTSEQIETVIFHKTDNTALGTVTFMPPYTPASSAQPVSKWNGYTVGSPPSNGIFLATDGSTANDGIAELTRDATGTDYAVNADGIAASTGWENATATEKYWIASFSTVGFTNLTFTSKQRGSNTGPKDFKVQYKVGASETWTDVANGTIVVANDNYITGVKENIPLPTAMNNQEEVFLRWLCTSSISINNGIVAATGVNRLDVSIHGEASTAMPTITVNPTTLSFGNVNTGTTSTPQSITISGMNLTGDLTYAKTGTDAAAFTITETSWNPATGGTLSVIFTPTQEKTYSANITVSSPGVESKIILLSGTGVVVSDLIWEESFEYTAGTLLTANGWTAHSGAGTNPVTVSEGSLLYLNYEPSGVGNKVTLTSSGEDVNHSFNDITSGVLYAAFMVNLTSAKSGGDYFVHFMGQNASTFSGRIFAKSGGTGYQLGITKATTAGSAVYADQILDFGATYLAVMKYEIVAGTANDIVSLFINPVVGNPEPAVPSATASDITGTDPTKIAGFALRQGAAASSPELALDGIRVAKSWNEAVKYQESNMPVLNVSPALLAFGNIELETTSSSQIITISGTNLTANIDYDKTGSDAAAFTITETSWNPATGGTLSITFSPAEARVYNASIVLSSNGAESKTVVLSGTGVTVLVPALIVSPASLNFGNVDNGTISPPQTITVSGTDLTATIDYDKTGADAAAFTITEPSWDPATGGTLNVTFSPTEARAYSASIVLSSNEAESKTVALNGTGVTALDFIWEDSFEYTAGSLLTANGWTAHSGAGTNPVTVSEGSLLYLNYEPSGIGNKVTLATSGEDVNHSFPDGNITSGTLYAAFMVNLTSATEGGDYFAHFLGQSATILSGRVCAKSNGSGYQLGIVKSAAVASAVYAGLVLDFGTTYLAVMKYEIISGTANDIVSLFINPVVGDAEPSAPSAIAPDATGADPTFIAGFALRQGGGTSAPVLALDGIRVAKTWNEAVKYLASTDPMIIVSPASLTFENVNVGATSTPQTTTVSGMNLTANINYTKTGSDAAAFTITETSWDPVTGGTLSVTFSPTEARAYSAFIVFNSTGADSKAVTLTGTGISTTSPPVAGFTADKTTVFAGGSIQFTDQSTGNPTSWSWSFTGGTPASSTQQNPTVTYNTAGSYTVSLTATNANGSDTETMPNYITVVPPGSNMVCNNSFETWTDNKPDCWFGAKTNFIAANVVQYATSAHTGTSACQLIETTSTHKRFTTQALSVINETTYQISFWVRGQGDIRTGLFDDRSTGSGYATYNPYINVNSTSWTQYTQEIEAANTSSIAEFIFSVRNTGADNDHIQIDDVEIIAATSLPGLSVTPENLSFGSVLVGGASAAKTLTISGNELTGNITYIKSGSDVNAFTVTETAWNPATGGTLSVTFSPTEERAYSASITVSSPGVESKTVSLSGTGTTTSGDFFEDFETLDGTESANYSGKEMTFASGLWYIKGVTSTTDENDRKNGARSVRLRGNAEDVEHRAEMMFDKPNGAGTVIFKYASYSVHSGGELQLQISTDQGATWQDKGDVIIVPSWAEGGSVLQTAETEINQDGNIRIRIMKVNAKQSSSVNIDDIEITDFGSSGPYISVSPTSLTFGDVEIQTVSPEKTLTVSGSNLAGNITYVKNGADADSFTITETSWNPAAGGTLSVIFAPTEAKVYSATIVFSSAGAASKTVTLSGTGNTGEIICNGGFEEWTDGKPNCWWGEKTTFTKANAMQYSANVHGGNYACQLINTESTHKRFSTQAVTVVAEKVYTITFWVRGKGDIRTALFDAREGNNGYSPYNEWISIDSDTWTQHTQTITAEIDAVNAEFIFSIKNTDENYDHIRLDDVEIQTETAIIEIPALDCTVYPNPTNGQLRIENGELKIENVDVFDIYGKKQFSILNFQLSTQFDISHLPTGMYFVKIKTKNGTVVHKVVKQ